MIPDYYLDAEKTKRKKKRTKLDTRLFLFTHDEEIEIRCAIRSAVAFMQTYGQAPAQPQIDIKHYIQSK